MEDITVIKGFLIPSKAASFFAAIDDEVNWVEELTNDEGNTVKIKRKMAYMSDVPELYRYANLSFMGTEWSNNLRVLRNIVSAELTATEGRDVAFNSVLLNRYNDGKDVINWHSDKEPSLGETPIIACLNLGTSRKFWFRKKEENSEKFFYSLDNGDLLVMGPNCQRDYLHAILKESEVKDPRISLTFRLNLPVGSW